MNSSLQAACAVLRNGPFQDLLRGTFHSLYQWTVIAQGSCSITSQPLHKMGRVAYRSALSAHVPDRVPAACGLLHQYCIAPPSQPHCVLHFPHHPRTNPNPPIMGTSACKSCHSRTGGGGGGRFGGKMQPWWAVGSTFRSDPLMYLCLLLLTRKPPRPMQARDMKIWRGAPVVLCSTQRAFVVLHAVRAVPSFRTTPYRKPHVS